MAKYKDQMTAVSDSGDWRPSNWTIACVGTVHLFFAAAVLTAVPPTLPPPELNVVDVVTIPNGDVLRDVSAPVELKQEAVVREFLPPKATLDRRYGPKATDRRTPPEQVPVPVPVPVPVSATAVPPLPLPEPKPPLLPAPATPPQKALPSPTPTPSPILLPNPEPVQLKTAPIAPNFALPDADPLSINGAKLKLKQVPAIKPLETLAISPRPTLTPTLPVVQNPPPTPKVSAPTFATVPPAPVAPAPAPASMPTSAASAAIQRKLSAPPPFAGPAPKPLTIPNTKAPLPKVQLPRIRATDLALPEVQSGAPAPLQNPPSGAGVTSLSRPQGPLGQGAGGAGALPSTAGQQSRPASSGSAGQAGEGVTAGSTAASGSQAAGSSVGGGNASGSTGMLPRSPGGASVRQPFPRGDTNTLLGRMDKTYDCSRLNRERDARCPEWNPIEGRNGRPSSQFEVPVPKGLPSLRNPNGTNPLPACPPGTAGNQMGLSCLPTREGPGIPRP